MILFSWLITDSVNRIIALTRNAHIVDQAAFSIIFPDWGIFYVLRPLVLVTLGHVAGRKEIRKFGGGRVWGISVEDPYFPSF